MVDTPAPDDRAVIGTWRRWALALGVTNVGFIASTVVLIAVTKADVLASTALVVAILAFLIQIVIFVAQFWISTEQTRVSSVATATIGERLQLLVDSFAYRKTSEGAAAAPTSEEGRPRRTPRDLFTRQAASSISPVEAIASLNLDTDTTIRLLAALPPLATDTPQTRYLLTEPADPKQVVSALDQLSRLHPFSVLQLVAFGRDEVVSQRLGLPSGLQFPHDSPTPGTDELEKRGFVQRQSVPPRSNDIMTLTDLGRSVVRLLLNHTPSPDETVAAIAETYTDAPADSRLRSP